MQPLIGITTHLSEDERTIQNNRTYSDALIAAGAIPVLLPVTNDPEVIRLYAERIDGLLLSGGVDVNPAMFGEDQRWECGSVSVLRDEFEKQLCDILLRDSTKPILGICRGLQLLSVALGSSMYQDLATCFDGKTLSHRQKQRAVYCSHRVEIKPGSRLHQIYGTETVMVNSLHHQAVRNLPEHLLESAKAPDGVIEAAELRGHPFCIGVQWHPEVIWDEPGGEIHQRLFQAFVQACQGQ